MCVGDPPPSEVWRAWGARVAQLFKHPTLDFDSGLDLRVMKSSPAWGSSLSGKSA